MALAEGRHPVVAPLEAGPLNVNADEMAGALAAGLGAERILFLTHVPGLLLAVELDRPAAGVVTSARGRGLLVGTAGEATLRLSPPLTITAGELDRALTVLEEVLA